MVRSEPSSRPPRERVTPTVDAGDLREFAVAILQAHGVARADATLAADAMVRADLRGRYAHGTSSKLPRCVARMKAGGTSTSGELPVVAETSVTFVLDGRHAWSQIAASKPMMVAAEKARSVGVSVGVVRDCSSAAAMGYYPLLAVAEGMIGNALTN